MFVSPGEKFTERMKMENQGPHFSASIFNECTSHGIVCFLINMEVGIGMTYFINGKPPLGPILQSL